MVALKRIIPLLGLFGLIAYLGYHSWTGDQGLLRRYQLDVDVVEAERLLSQVRDERLQLEDQVARLSESADGAGIDIDYLEEIARSKLEFAHPDEIIVKIDRDYGGAHH